MGPLPGPKEPAPSNPRFRIDRADSAGAPGKQEKRGKMGLAGYRPPDRLCGDETSAALTLSSVGLEQIHLAPGVNCACWCHCCITASISPGITSPSGQLIQAELRISSGRDKYP